MGAAAIERLHAYSGFGEALREPLQRALPDRELVVWDREEQFAAGIEEVEALLEHHAPRGHWSRARRLRLIQTIGAGVDSVLPAPELPEHVQIANARGIHEPEMSEFALGLILALAKRVPRALAQQREHQWKLFGTRRLAGGTLGILGLGTIGQAVARRGRMLGMRVIGTKRTPEPLPDVDEVLPPEETRRVLQQSDVVVVVVPRTPATEGLLDAEALACMKRSALLVNIARGGIVDEAALAHALRERRIGGAALDVFEQEPLPASSPLWEAPNLLITPHNAGLTNDYMQKLCDIFVENVRRVERGEPLLNPVDRSKGY